LSILRILQERLQTLFDQAGPRRAESILRRFDASIDDLESTSNDLRVAIARYQSDIEAADAESRIEHRTIERLKSEQSKGPLDERTSFHLQKTLNEHERNCSRIDSQKQGLQAHLKMLESGLKELDSELGRLRNNRSLLGERLTLASARQKLYRSRGGIGQTSRWEQERQLSDLVRQAALTAGSIKDLMRSRR
jgi:chromosome segregation ATPase